MLVSRTVDIVQGELEHSPELQETIREHHIATKATEFFRSTALWYSRRVALHTLQRRVRRQVNINRFAQRMRTKRHAFLLSQYYSYWCTYIRKIRMEEYVTKKCQFKLLRMTWSHWLIKSFQYGSVALHRHHQHMKFQRQMFYQWRLFTNLSKNEKSKERELLLREELFMKLKCFKVWRKYIRVFHMSPEEYVNKNRIAEMHFKKIIFQAWLHQISYDIERHHNKTLIVKNRLILIMKMNTFVNWARQSVCRWHEKRKKKKSCLKLWLYHINNKKLRNNNIRISQYYHNEILMRNTLKILYHNYLTNSKINLSYNMIRNKLLMDIKHTVWKAWKQFHYSRKRVLEDKIKLTIVLMRKNTIQYYYSTWKRVFAVVKCNFRRMDEGINVAEADHGTIRGEISCANVQEYDICRYDGDEYSPTGSTMNDCDTGSSMDAHYGSSANESGTLNDTEVSRDLKQGDGVDDVRSYRDSKNISVISAPAVPRPAAYSRGPSRMFLRRRSISASGISTRRRGGTCLRPEMIYECSMIGSNVQNNSTPSYQRINSNKSNSTNNNDVNKPMSTTVDSTRSDPQSSDGDGSMSTSTSAGSVSTSSSSTGTSTSNEYHSQDEEMTSSPNELEEDIEVEDSRSNDESGNSSFSNNPEKNIGNSVKDNTLDEDMYPFLRSQKRKYTYGKKQLRNHNEDIIHIQSMVPFQSSNNNLMIRNNYFDDMNDDDDNDNKDESAPKHYAFNDINNENTESVMIENIFPDNQELQESHSKNNNIFNDNNELKSVNNYSSDKIIPTEFMNKNNKRLRYNLPQHILWSTLFRYCKQFVYFILLLSIFHCICIEHLAYANT